MAGTEQYKGFVIKTGEELYEFQNPTQQNSMEKQIIDKLYANGTSADRPTSATAQLGESYFDTTMGYPIWWQGTKWVQADGTDAPV